RVSDPLACLPCSSYPLTPLHNVVILLRNFVIITAITGEKAMTEEEKGHLEIEDRAADHAQDTKGATIMRTNDTPNEGVITSYAQAPARSITAGGVTYAYRESARRAASR